MSGVLLAPLTGAFFVIYVATLAVKIWALVDALTRPQGAFVATGKQTKVLWVAILAVAAVTNGSPLLGLIGLVAAIVYLVDVRPAVRGLRRG